MCLGGGVRCPNASSYNYSRRVKQNLLLHLKGYVHKLHKSTYMVLPPTTEVCFALRIFLVYAKIFVLNSEKSDCCLVKNKIYRNNLLCFIAVL